MFRTHQREENHVANRGSTGHQHRQSVDADAETGCRRHTDFECHEEIFVEHHRFVVATGTKPRLLFETLALVAGVVELAERIGDLHPADVQLEALDERRVVPVALGKRRHFHRMIDDKRRCNECRLNERAEEFVDELGFRCRGCDIYIVAAAERVEFFARKRLDALTDRITDRIEQPNTAERSLQRYRRAVGAEQCRLASHLAGDGHQQLFGHVHEPVIVAIGDVNFECREFRIVHPVDAFVAEVLRDFVHALEAPDNEPLEVQFVGDAQVERHVERIEMRHERSRGRSAVDRLQNRRFDFEPTALVEEAADGCNHAAPLDERFSHVRIDDQVEIAPAVSLLFVGECIVNDDVPVLVALFFDHRQRSERLAEQHERTCMDGDFASACAKNEPTDTHDVADVEQAQHLVLARQFVGFDVALNLAVGILNVEERRFPHPPNRHDATGDSHVGKRRWIVVTERFENLSRSVRSIEAVRVRFDAAGDELVQLFVAAANLVVLEFDAHVGKCQQLSRWAQIYQRFVGWQSMPRAVVRQLPRTFSSSSILMRIDLVCPVPQSIESLVTTGIVGRARERGIVEIVLHNLHDYADNRFGHIDDEPYGGGAGMVIRCEPVFACIERLLAERQYDDVIYMTPDGQTLTQSVVNELSLERNIIVLAGRYKGVDQRIRDALVTREISIGDYVISSGELAAAVLVDAIVRLIPGAISDAESALDDSFQDGLLSAPVYTRPAMFRGIEVPPVLRSGDHEAIRRWRYEQALLRTQQRRPDLLVHYRTDQAQ